MLSEGENVGRAEERWELERGLLTLGIWIRFSTGAYSVAFFLFPIFCSIEPCRRFCRSAALITTDRGSCESYTISRRLQHEGQHELLVMTEQDDGGPVQQLLS